LDNIIVRKGRREDAKDSAALCLLSGPTLVPCLFGSHARDLLENLFKHARNWFSFEHSHFVEVNGEVAGMALAYTYDQRKSEELRDGLLFIRYMKWRLIGQLPHMLRAMNIAKQFARGESYLSNVAVYPRFRGLGLGTKLIEAIEEEARTVASKRMVLDVETDNGKAIRLYERLNYRIERKSPVLRIRDKAFQFYKMSKDIECG